MLRMSEFRQLLMGISTSRYLPPRGTAGLALSFVSGKSLVPAPPPMMIARVRSTGGMRGSLLIRDSHHEPSYPNCHDFQDCLQFSAFEQSLPGRQSSNRDACRLHM